MSRMKIKDIAVQKNERVDNPSHSPYSIFVGLEHYDSGEATIRRFGSTERLESAMKVFHAGDMLVARRNVYLKRAATVSFDGLTSGDSIVLHIADEEIRRIIPFVLNSDDFWNYANRHADGSMSKRLSPKLLMEYEFSIPDDNLHQAAEILWAMERVKNAYRELIARTDDLVKSQFCETITSLLDGGKTMPLNDLVEDDRPITYGILKPGTGYPGGVPVVKVKDMRDGVIDQTKLLLTTPELDNRYRRSRLRAGDLLISIRGSVGRMAEVPKNLENANITQDTARLTIKPEYNKIYIRGVLESEPLQQDMERNIRGVAVKGINIGYLRLLGIPMCDRIKQDRLANLYQQSDKSKKLASETSEAISIAENIIGGMNYAGNFHGTKC